MKIKIFLTIALTLVLMTYLDSSGNCEVEDREPIPFDTVDGVIYYDNRDTISYTDSTEDFLVTTSPLLGSASMDGFMEYDYDWKAGRNTQGEFEVAINLKEMYVFGNHTQPPIDYEEIMKEFLRNTITEFNRRFGPSVFHFSMPSCWDTSASVGPGIGAEFEGRSGLDTVPPLDDMYITRWQPCGEECCIQKVYFREFSGLIRIDSIVTVINDVCPDTINCMQFCGFLESSFDGAIWDVPPGYDYYISACKCQYNNLLSPGAFEPDTVDFAFLNEPYEMRYVSRSCDLDFDLETIVLQILIAHTNNYAHLDSVLPAAVKHVLNDVALNHTGTFPIERTLQSAKCWGGFGTPPSDTMAAPCGALCCSHSYLIDEIAPGVYSATPTGFGYSDNFDCNYSPCDSNVCDLLYVGGQLPKMNFSRAAREIENYYSKVIPNPATDFVKIEYEAPENGSVRLEIYNVNSELMIDLSQNKKSKLSSFDFSTAKLTTGTYYYKIWVEGINTSIGNFVIKR